MGWDSNSYDADLMQQDLDWFGEGADTAYNDSLSAGMNGTLGDWQGGYFPEGQSDFDFSNFMGSQFNYSPDPSMNLNMNLNNSFGGGYSQPLDSVGNNGFSNPEPSSSTNDFVKQLLQNPDKFMKGIAALFEGNQNKKYSSALNKIAQNPVFDPFGSQRSIYQGALSNAVSNPYDSPIVANQVNALQQAQARKDAAAGRRSNVVGSAPAVLGAQAAIANDYMKTLMTPAGANINPNSSALANLYQNAAKANTQGYTSPVFSALGQMSQDDLLRALIAKL